ncbi:unnamed protein product [Closterium sp. NIES-54]
MATSVLSLLDRSPDDPVTTQLLATLASSSNASSSSSSTGSSTSSGSSGAAGASSGNTSNSSNSSTSSGSGSSAGGASSPLEAERKAFPAVRGRAACEYVNYKALGLSLCVEEGRVAAVHVYSNVHGYKAFAGTLPFGLK